MKSTRSWEQATRPARCLSGILLALFISPAWPTEPPNLGDLQTQLIAYHDYGGYDADLRAVVGTAQAYLQERVKAQKADKAHKGQKLAMVLDIDETALSNWPKIVANQFAYFPAGTCDDLKHPPCGELAWEGQAGCVAIGPTLDLYKTARSLGITVFFVTGRSEEVREATERNLQRVGYAGFTDTQVMMQPKGQHAQFAAEFKAPARAKIEAMGYEIIANVGDQPSDLAGGHAERAFQLPDPFYRIP